MKVAQRAVVSLLKTHPTLESVTAKEVEESGGRVGEAIMNMTPVIFPPKWQECLISMCFLMVILYTHPLMAYLPTFVMRHVSKYTVSTWIDALFF